MKKKYYIGIMSGTSMDSIDYTICSFKNKTISLIAVRSFKYPSKIRESIIKIFRNNYVASLEKIEELNIKLSLTYVKHINIILSREKLRSSDIRAIGCHGQTILHKPNFIKYGFTIQLARGDIIAKETRINTVVNFRDNDILNGGQGAPLVPAFHQAFFSKNKTKRVIVNIGGIANITFLNFDKHTIGFDTGPGNTLLDQWIFKHKNLAFDKDGTWGAQGKVIRDLLNKMINDPYFHKRHPKSTGTNYFNIEWLNNFFPNNYKKVDIQTTLHALTILPIATAINKFQPDTQEVYICGGGAKNKFLIELLESQLDNIKIMDTKDLGIGGQWVESCAFAWFAKCNLDGKILELSNVTGTKLNSILGTLHKY